VEAPKQEAGSAPRVAPRVALVAASLDNVGGHGVEAALLADVLRRDGHLVRFIPINPRFPQGLGWVRGVPYLRTALSMVLYLPSLFALRHADVVHVFAASYWSFLLGPVPAILAGRLFRRRVVLHYHSGEAADHLARWGRRVHPWLRRVDAIVVPSSCAGRVFERHGYRPRVIPNVIDLSLFHYRERSPLRPCLLSTRNLEPHYRVDQTIAAFAIVRTRYPQATLAIAGYGTEEERLWGLAAAIGAGGVTFLGRVEPQNVPKLYDDCDIFVNSSVVDNQPLPILEAFAAGTPVVSTDTGGIPEMVRHAATGLIVPAGDPGATARAVIGLLEEPDIALQLAATARESVKAHTWPCVRQAWAAVYAGEES